MKLFTEEAEGKVYFRITEFAPKYLPVFRACYYQEYESGFYKVYPASYPGIEGIRQNFVHYGQTMFDQLGYFAPNPWKKGLLTFIERVAGRQLNWWLTGSCAVCLRGIPLQPHDVDIMVDSADISAIMEIFKDDIFEPILGTDGWVTKDFGVLFLGCRIDIASDPADCMDDPEPVDCGPFAKAHLETIIWQGHAVKIPPLALSIAVNKRRERWDRVKLMEDFQLKPSHGLGT